MGGCSVHGEEPQQTESQKLFLVLKWNLSENCLLMGPLGTLTNSYNLPNSALDMFDGTVSIESYYMYVHWQVPWNSRIIHYLPFRCWC